MKSTRRGLDKDIASQVLMTLFVICGDKNTPRPRHRKKQTFPSQEVPVTLVLVGDTIKKQTTEPIQKGWSKYVLVEHIGLGSAIRFEENHQQRFCFNVGIIDVLLI